MKNMKKDIRIGIIGAGPSGLAAAEALREKGYKNITVLEKRDRAGGMALSRSYRTPDNREIIYELGSLQPTSSKTLYTLMDRYGMHIGKTNLGIHSNPNKPLYFKKYSLKERKAIVDFLKYPLGFPLSQFPSLFVDGMKLAAALYQYRCLSKPGYQIPLPLAKKLYISFDQWVDETHFLIMGDLLKLFTSMATFSNPKIRHHISALEFIKFIHHFFRHPVRYINGTAKLVAEGYQELWNRVAKQHNVMFNVHIKKISRYTDHIEVELPDNTLHFDKLLISMSPSESLRILDCTTEEKALFSSVKYAKGWRAAFTAKNLPHDAGYAFHEPYAEENFKPIVQTFYPEGEVGDGVWLYSSVLNCEENTDVDPYLRETEKIFKDQFNAEVLEWIDLEFWPEYSPYFSLEDIKKDAHDRLNQLQGNQNTYFLGGIFSSHTHALVTEHAYYIIDSYF